MAAGEMSQSSVQWREETLLHGRRKGNPMHPSPRKKQTAVDARECGQSKAPKKMSSLFSFVELVEQLMYKKNEEEERHLHLKGQRGKTKMAKRSPECIFLIGSTFPLALYHRQERAQHILLLTWQARSAVHSLPQLLRKLGDVVNIQASMAVGMVEDTKSVSALSVEASL